jgi:hypothetical protein
MPVSAGVSLDRRPVMPGHRPQGAASSSSSLEGSGSELNRRPGSPRAHNDAIIPARTPSRRPLPQSGRTHERPPPQPSGEPGRGDRSSSSDREEIGALELAPAHPHGRQRWGACRPARVRRLASTFATAQSAPASHLSSAETQLGTDRHPWPDRRRRGASRDPRISGQIEDDAAGGVTTGRTPRGPSVAPDSLRSGNPALCGASLSTATGIRTPVSAVRGRRPSPLDDSGARPPRRVADAAGGT